LTDLTCGGSISFTYNVTADCDTKTCTSTFTVISPDDLDLPVISDEIVDACDFEDQDELIAAFNAWVTAAQAQALADVGGGCGAEVTNNAASQTLPDICTGGVVTVTWTITDLCFTTTVEATFTVNPPASVTPPVIAGDEVDACDFEDQDELIAAATLKIRMNLLLHSTVEATFGWRPATLKIRMNLLLHSMHG
jgi:hypothetical protein